MIPTGLRRIFDSLGRCAVLFSGGHDSEVLLRVAVNTLGPDMVISLTAASPFLAGFYTDVVRAVTEELGLEPVIAGTPLLEDPSITANDERRCYFCKKTIYRVLKSEARSRNFGFVMDGTNLDDLGAERPGLAAALEESIIHPFVQAGMGRRDITELGRALGTSEEGRPSDSCLATRIPPGTLITRGLLGLVEEMEAPLRPLVSGRFRVRAYPGILAVEYCEADREAVEKNTGKLRSIAGGAGLSIELRKQVD
ncbi:MAG: hypothetical protein JXA64_00070 [Candidatus Fermentibacteraceae bacterium]|nr:hypothetical protein [Candidatus Fermentibacteraceae bacterium]MBN2607479.1 hypothetical protein [Candidatus Fermentibacteraceae bacterium]